MLPGTGWRVKRYGVEGGRGASGEFEEGCVELAGDLCPFVRRVFSRLGPTDDSDEGGGVEEEWCGTKRPLFDLDG